MKVSSHSLTLWQEALQYLKKNQTVDFLNALERLRSEVEMQFQYNKQYGTTSELSSHYEKIYTQLGINNDTLFQHISKSRYRSYCRMLAYIQSKRMEANDTTLDDNTTDDRSAHLMKAVAMSNVITYFLPHHPKYEKYITTQVSRKLCQQVDDLLDHQLEIVADDAPTPQARNDITTALQNIRSRLQAKYDTSWFTCLNRDIQEKIHDIDNLERAINPAPNSRSINAALKAAEQGSLARHRSVATSIYALFSGKKTRTVEQLEKIRQRLYDNEARRRKIYWSHGL